MSVVLVILVLAAYFVPAIVAASRAHPQAAPIGVVNLFLGWTLVGWAVALAWSLSAFKDPVPRFAPPAGPALDTKRCPDCAEAVQAAARRCRYCGFAFPEPEPIIAPAPEHRPSFGEVEASKLLNPAKPATGLRSGVIAIMAILGVVTAAALIYGAASPPAAPPPAPSTPAPSSSWATSTAAPHTGFYRTGQALNDAERGRVVSACRAALRFYAGRHAGFGDLAVSNAARIDEGGKWPKVTCGVERASADVGEIATDLNCTRGAACRTARLSLLASGAAQ